MSYDGTTPLQPEVAQIVGCSVKSQSKIAAVIKLAKQELRIKTKARVLPTKTKLAIYSHIVKIYSQDNSKQSSQKSVKIITQDKVGNPVEIISQDRSKKCVDIISQKEREAEQLGVEINSQNNSTATSPHTEQASVEIDSQVNNFDNIRIAFYVALNGKRTRQVISLDGFFINALASIRVSKVDVPKWIQAQVDNWTAFDSLLPITRQVKYLIMREVVKGLSDSDDIFFN